MKDINKYSKEDLEHMLMSVTEFIEAVKCGAFIDYDGFGHPTIGNKYDESVDIVPSKVKQKGETIFEGYDGILWFNR